MKLMVILFFIFGLCTAIYLFITYFIFNFNKLRKINWVAFWIAAFVGLSLVTIIGIAIYRGSKAPDTWCTTLHATNSYPPTEVKTAMDYFEKGNYEYDSGKCKEAVESYAQSIRLNGKYPQAYNNKAYTEMRMQNYKDALTDLNIALTINPNYVSALMNRGDIYNYYLNPVDRQKAITDYKKIIALSGNRGSVCGHLAMAKYYNNKNPFTYLTVIYQTLKCQKML